MQISGGLHYENGKHLDWIVLLDSVKSSDKKN